MRPINTNKQTQHSAPSHPSFAKHKHFLLIPSLPQHIQVCTYCCFPTQQQRSPHKTTHHSEVLSNVTVIFLLSPTYPTDLLLTHSTQSTGETRPITHHITCNSKNLIYMIQCKRCHKQYIGETKKAT